MSCFLFIVIGHAAKSAKIKINLTVQNTIVWIIAVILLLFLNIKTNFSVDIRQNKCSNWWIYVVIALLGIFCIIYFSKIITEKTCLLKNALGYIGRNTLCILFLHIVIFKLIGLFQIYVLDYSYEGNFRLWGTVESSGAWSYVYCFLGIIVPLFLAESGKRIWCLTKKTVRIERVKKGGM